VTRRPVEGDISPPVPRWATATTPWLARPGRWRVQRPQPGHLQHRNPFRPRPAGPQRGRQVLSAAGKHVAPSIGTDGELPAGDEKAIFTHYGLEYRPGANGERLLGRR
jgi:hypothetical protein